MDFVTLWIRIRIKIVSVFRNFVDPAPYSEYGSGSTQVKIRQIRSKGIRCMTKIHHSKTQLTKNVFRYHDFMGFFKIDLL